MSQQKYYAVRVGRQPGIYQTWAECQAQTNGFKGAVFKSFPSLADAEAFLLSTESLQKDKSENKSVKSKIAPIIEDYDQRVIADLKNARIVAFVDGSFSDSTGVPLAGFGCYILHQDEIKPVEIGKKMATDQYASSRNIAPEVFGALEALNWASSHGYKAITIYHDLQNTGKWARGEYQAHADISKLFMAELAKYKEILDIEFVWVKGHAGIEYNEKADQLAYHAMLS
ncbi:ribonuclease H family protein [Wohlfahrtiimonas chitiniclastica]|uniref:ribonuclease H family protein n=1 Tax=Wohlfahrtiimonas chitiniclastica TaxID=400946 RepID=UPI002157844C|nr:ribonuclease H family protein [Wohlfahrtiimonas chitiniclastica]MDC7251171.1 ribonuclease HI [Wohlfahrtiimonas chitiniclastica]